MRYRAYITPAAVGKQDVEIKISELLTGPFVTGAPTHGQIRITSSSIVSCAAKKVKDVTCPSAANTTTADGSAENLTTAIDTTGFTSF